MLLLNTVVCVLWLWRGFLISRKKPGDVVVGWCVTESFLQNSKAIGTNRGVDKIKIDMQLYAALNLVAAIKEAHVYSDESSNLNHHIDPLNTKELETQTARL